MSRRFLPSRHLPWRPSRRRAAAFTLVELVTVIVILGVLSVIAVPTYSRVITNSTLSRDANTLNSVVENALSIAAGNGGGVPTAAEVIEAVNEMPPLSGATWSTRQTTTTNPNPSVKYGQVSFDVTDSTKSAGFAMVSSNGDCVVDLLSGATTIPWSYNYTLAFCDGTIAFAGPNQPNPQAAGLGGGSEGPGGYTQVAGNPPSAAPTGVVATVSGTNSTVTWNPVSVDYEGSGPITGYEATATPTGSIGSPLSCTATSTTCTIVGLSPGVIYGVTVVAQNVYGSGPASSPAVDVVSVSAPIGAPTSVTATAGSNDDATITWTDVPSSEDGGSAITSYAVTSVQNSTLGCNTGGSGTSCTVTGLTGGTSYTFEVAAASANGTGPESSPSNAVTPEGVPTTPTGVVALQASTTSISLSWNASSANGSALTGYAIRYSTDSGSTWTTYTNSTGSSSTAATMTGLTTGTTYIVEVEAKNAVGTSSWSSATASLTLTDAPAAPTQPSASAVGNTGLSVNWSAPFANGSPITGYAIRYSSNGGSTWTTFTSNTQSTNTSATIPGLTAGNSYVVEVVALNAVGTGTWSPASSSVTLPSAPAAPAAPGANQQGSGALTLNWSAPASNGSPITGYAIRYSSDGGNTWTTFTSNTGNTLTSDQLTGLSLETTYVEDVAAINAYGTSAWSPVSNAVTFASSPAAPSSLNVTEASPTSLYVTWGAPNNNGAAITGYAIQYSCNNGSSWTTWSANTGSTATSATITGLTTGATCIVEVAAINAQGQSAWSSLALAQSNAQTLATVPSAPAAPTATDAGATSIQAVWSAPSNGGAAITGYAIRYSSNSGSTWTTFTSNTGSTSTSTTVTGLTTGATYIVEVAAINAVGTSAYSSASNAVQTATVPATPAQPSVTGTEDQPQMTVNYTAPSNGGTPVTDYVVRYSTDDATWTTDDTQSTSLSTTLTNLNETTYYVEVAAKNAVGQSAWSTADTVAWATVDSYQVADGYYCPEGTLDGEYANYYEGSHGIFSTVGPTNCLTTQSASEEEVQTGTQNVVTGVSCPSGWTANSDDSCQRTAYVSQSACNADNGSWNAVSGGLGTGYCTLYTSGTLIYTTEPTYTEEEVCPSDPYGGSEVAETSGTCYYSDPATAGYATEYDYEFED